MGSNKQTFIYNQIISKKIIHKKRRKTKTNKKNEQLQKTFTNMENKKKTKKK